jgi:alkylated DNA repair dioxygenase AlkB
MKRHYLSKDSWIKVIPEAIGLDDDEFRQLWRMHPVHRDSMMMFGKMVTLPRYQALYGNDVVYRFSGSALQSRPVKSPILKKVMDYTNEAEPKFEYNGILVNWYRDGHDYVGPHADDEHDLVPTAPIYSYSFGASRLFRFIHNESKEKTDILLEHGDLLIMGGRCQQEFKHALPKALRIKEKRINLTVRAFKK